MAAETLSFATEEKVPGENPAGKGFSCTVSSEQPEGGADSGPPLRGRDTYAHTHPLGRLVTPTAVSLRASQEGGAFIGEQ